MNILIVDDSSDIRKMLQRLLTQAGHAAVTAEDGLAALKALAREPVDVVLTDVMMPGMDGYRLCQTVRGMEGIKDIPFIFHSSAYTTPADKKLALDLGANAFLNKPASVDEILETLRRVTSEPRAVRPLAAVATPEVEVMREYSDRLVAKLEQRNTELAAAEGKFRTLVEQSIVGIYLIQDDQFVYVNPRMAEILGTPVGELTARPVYEFIAPEHRALAKENVRRRIAGEVASIHYQLRMLHQSGTVLEVEAHGSRTDYNGRPAVMGTLLDITERKQAEAALQTSEERYRALVDLAPAGIFVIVDNQFAYANDAFCRIVGADSPAQLLGRPVLELYPPEAHHAIGERITRSIAADEAEPLLTQPYVRRDGSRVEVETIARPITFQGRPGLQVMVNDVTQRKQAESAMLAAEAKYRNLFENVIVGVFQTTPGGRYLAVNPALAQMYGYASAEDMLASLTDIQQQLYLDPGRREEFKRLMEERGEVSGLESQIKRKDGSIIWISETARAVRDPQGRVLHYEGIVEDITERIKIAEKVREHAALLDLTTDAIIVRDLALRVTYWNKGAEGLYGWTPEEAVGRLTTELHAGNAWEGREAARQQVEKQGSWQGELQHRTKAGKILIVDSRWTLLRSATGAPQAVLVINNDITEKKRLEAQFLRSQRMESIGSLAGGIAHDLNNALAPIVMSTEILRMTIADPEAGRILDTISDCAERGAGMVKQILTFARGSEGERGSVQPKHLVKEMIEIARHTFPKGISIRTEVDGETWPLLGNPTQLHQILLNLCVNARDAMPNGGTLTMAAGNVRLKATDAVLPPDAKPGPYVLLTVKDTGTGMTPEVRARIFDAFFTTKEPGKGTGLGLSTVQSIVKEHSGFLAVESEVGRGTMFKVYLPAQESASATEETELPALPMGNGELVLVVDDEAAIRGIAAETLEAFGYRAVTAGDGAQAVGVCAQNLAELQVVFTDMAMPIMDGPAAIRAIRVLSPKLKIIATSGADEMFDSPLLKELEVQAFLHKPYGADALVRAVHDVLHPSE